MGKNLPAMQETQVQSLGWEDILEKEMATHSSILAWRIPWTESGRLDYSPCMPSLFSHVQLFVTLWTVAHQAPLSTASTIQTQLLCSVHPHRGEDSLFLTISCHGHFLPEMCSAVRGCRSRGRTWGGDRIAAEPSPV